MTAPLTPPVLPPTELHRRSLRARLFLIVVAVVATVLVTFAVTSTLSDVPDNARAIQASCEDGNRQIAKVNKKFADLIALFDRATPPGQVLPPDVEAAYATFRRPIPLTDCDNLEASS